MNHANLVEETADNATIKVNNNYELAASYSVLQSNSLGGGDIFFAYPNGAFDSAVINKVYNSLVISQIEKQGNYVMARALGYGITQPNMYPDDPYNLSMRVQSLVMTPSVTPAT